MKVALEDVEIERLHTGLVKGQMKELKEAYSEMRREFMAKLSIQKEIRKFATVLQDAYSSTPYDSEQERLAQDLQKKFEKLKSMSWL